MGGRGGSSGMSGGGSGGGVTRTSIPSVTQENLQKFVNQFGTGMTVSDMVDKVYSALPTVGTARTIGGVIAEKGWSITNGRYLENNSGTTIYQFIRQKSKGTWKVNKLR